MSNPAFNNLLQVRKEPIVDRWVDGVLASYPEESRKFLRRGKDPFGNPVGQTIVREIGELFDTLLAGAGIEAVADTLDSIMRIRAVQGLSTAAAVGFVFYLKECIREEIGQEILDQGLQDALGEFDRRVDGMALLAFEVYLRCREKVWELRANEMKKRTHLLLKRATKLYGMEEAEEEKKED